MVLNGFAVYKGNNQLDRLGIVKATMPKIEFNKETVTVAGILGDIKKGAVGNTKEYDVSIEFLNASEEHFDLLDPNGTLLTFRGQIQTTSGTKAMKVVIKAETNGLELGDFEPSKKMGTKIEVTTPYLYIEIDGDEVFEHDKENMVYRVKGKDMLLRYKKDLGLI